MTTGHQDDINFEERLVINEGVATGGGDFIGRDKHILGDEIRGNKIVGAIIENLAGDVIVAPSLENDPPNQATVCAYLTRAVEKDRPPEGPKAEQFASLWSVSFFAHQASEPSQDLYYIIKTTFMRARKLEAFQRLVILADAGMGKTPALYHLRRKCAEDSLRILLDEVERTNARTVGVIPLYINLTNLYAGLSFVALVRDSFNMLIEPSEEVHKITLDEAGALLDTYICLFLFDDLGELQAKQQEGSLQKISQLMETNPEHQYVLSCRTANYRQQLGAMYTLYLDDLSDSDAKFILGSEVYERLSTTLQQLTLNRAMLKIILELDEAERISQTKGKLLQFYILKRLKPDDDVRHEMVEGLLAQLAFSMQRDQSHTYSEHKLMEVVTSYLTEWHEPYHWRVVVKELCEKEMLKCEEDRQWSFRDRTVEAFFAAWAAIHDPACLQYILDNVSNVWWREVVEILIGLTLKPIDLLFELIDRDVFVAANCLRFAGGISNQFVEDALVDALLERLGQESSSRRCFIIERIGESMHPRSTQALLIALRREWSSRVVLTICKALVPRLGKKRGAWKKVEAFEFLSSSQRLETIIALLQGFGIKGSEVRLKSFIQNIKLPPQVRGIAAICLGFRNTPQSRVVLLDLLMEQRQDDFVSWCIVDALTQYNHPDVVSAIIQIYKNKAYKSRSWASLRAQSIYLLGWTQGAAETANLLRMALRDRDPYVRGYAVDSIMRIDFRDRRQLIEHLLLVEKEPFVLRRAAEALGRIGTDDSVMVLEKHLLNERARTRWMVRKAITEIKQRSSLH